MKMLKRTISLILAFCMILSIQTLAFADEQEGEGDNVVITEADKPYLALGADLSTSQLNTVLDLMGISADNLNDYDVVYVTNQEEHTYLDEYIPSKQIGTHALSSVVITKAESGSGLKISTYNINYCTVGMYKNALTTAGITDANIIVAGPTSLSGTCALVGILKAYQEMSGEDIDDEVIDAAMDELVTTGEIEDALGDEVDSEIVEAIIAELKQRIADGLLENEQQMRDAIAELCEEYGIVLDEDEIQLIIDLLSKLKGLNLDWDAIADQAGYWAGKIQELSKNVTKDDVNGFFDIVERLMEQLRNFFTGLFN